MIEMDRRTALALASSGLTALAGCSDPTSDGGSNGDEGADSKADSDADASIETGDLPAYASVLAETESEEYFFGAIDLEALSTIASSRGDHEAGENPEDPLVRNPVAFLITFQLFSRLGRLPAYDAFADNDETSSDEGHVLLVEGVNVLYGSFDVDGAEADLETAGYASAAEGDDFSVFVDEETGDSVGVTPSVFAFASPDESAPTFDPRDAVEGIVRADAGDTEPKHATDVDFEWLLRAGTGDGIALCYYAETEALPTADLESEQPDEGTEALTFDFSAFEGARGVHQHLSMADDGGAHAETVVSYDDEAAVDADRLESRLGSQADSVDLLTDGAAVRVEAEYEGDVVEGS
ncbi:hypothetical protein ACFQGT_03870 [Natrialbaceae archaeon GCM10025810]|uniref:hypothetical protein n=1 Tax=Halovalidus salilacus TaxID=3075124 RepID=UPI003610F50C